MVKNPPGNAGDVRDAGSTQSRLGARGQGASAERDHLQPISSSTSENEEQVDVQRRHHFPSPSLPEGSLRRLEPGPSAGQGGPELGG